MTSVALSEVSIPWPSHIINRPSPSTIFPLAAYRSSTSLPAPSIYSVQSTGSDTRAYSRTLLGTIVSAGSDSNLTINQRLLAESASAPNGTMSPKDFRQLYKNKPLRYVIILTKILALSSDSFAWSGVPSDITPDDLKLFDYCANQAFVIVIRRLPPNLVFGLSLYPAHVCLWAVQALLAEPAKFRRHTRLWTRKLLLLDPSSDINANIRRVRNALDGADYLRYPVGIMGAIQLFFCIENKGVAWQYKKMLIEVPEILHDGVPQWTTLFPLAPIRWGMLAASYFHYLLMLLHL